MTGFTMTGNRFPLINGRHGPWPCPCMQRSQLPEAQWRRAPHFSSRDEPKFKLWKWGFIPKNIYIYKLIENFHEKFWIESSKTGGEEWLFKYQYSKSYQQEMWLCWKSNGHQQLWNDGFGYMVQMTPQKKNLESKWKLKEPNTWHWCLK